MAFASRSFASFFLFSFWGMGLGLQVVGWSSWGSGLCKLSSATSSCQLPGLRCKTAALDVHCWEEEQPHIWWTCRWRSNLVCGGQLKLSERERERERERENKVISEKEGLKFIIFINLWKRKRKMHLPTHGVDVWLSEHLVTFFAHSVQPCKFRFVINSEAS